MRILVVEDEPKMASLVRRGLEREGYVVDVVGTGAEALWAAAEVPPAAIVLDVGLPDLDGITVCRRLRDAGCWASIVILTARDAVDDRVRGLDAGADDYLTKPFALSELAARLRAVVRRENPPRPSALRHDDLTLDPATRQVRIGEEEVALSATEFAVLEVLLRRPGTVHTRAELRDQVWDPAYEGTSNVVDVYIRYLREKIDRPFGTDHIETVRGVGYRLRPPLVAP